MISIFDLIVLSPRQVITKLVRPVITRSNDELLLDLVNEYNNQGLLDEYSRDIVNSNSFIIHSTEPRAVLEDQLLDVGLDIDYSNIPTMLMVVLLTVNDLGDNNLWFYMIKELKDSVILAILGSAIMTQDLFDLIYSFYKNLPLGQLLIEEGENYGFEIPSVTSNYSVFEQAMNYLPLPELLNAASINKEMSMLVTNNLKQLSIKYGIVPPAKSIDELDMRYKLMTGVPESLSEEITRRIINDKYYTPEYEEIKGAITLAEFYKIIYNVELRSDDSRFVVLCNVYNKMISNQDRISCNYLKYMLLADAFRRDKEKFNRMLSKETYNIIEIMGHEFYKLAAYAINQNNDILRSAEIYDLFANMDIDRYNALKHVFDYIKTDNPSLLAIKDEFSTDGGDDPEGMQARMLNYLDEFYRTTP